MAERDCSKHTNYCWVKLIRQKLTRKQHSNLIAGLLRTIADYTDGYCSTRGADDDEIEKPSGMMFSFQDDTKLDTFKRRLEIYLDDDIYQALEIYG